jgi:hypothetical protein
LQCVSCHPCMTFYIGFDGCKRCCLVALNHAQQIPSLHVGARSQDPGSMHQRNRAEAKMKRSMFWSKQKQHAPEKELWSSARPG